MVADSNLAGVKLLGRKNDDAGDPGDDASSGADDNAQPTQTSRSGRTTTAPRAVRRRSATKPRAPGVRSRPPR